MDNLTKLQNEFQVALEENREILAQFTLVELKEEARSLRIVASLSQRKAVLVEDIARKWARLDIPAPVLVKDHN